MDESGENLYKYSCRKCPIRTRCIDDSDNSPIIKDSIRNAFNNKTDTLELWAHLQVNCLLEKADQQAQEAGKESLLNRRLRLAREAKLAKSAPPSPTKSAGKQDLIEPHPYPQPKPRLTPQSFAGGSFQSRPADIRDPGQVTKQEIFQARSSGQRHWLTVRRSGRHINLPQDGELVLGRFDPSFGVPPDVDLTFEDVPTPSISRRHARIVGQGGIHTIQEMGSKLGVEVNGKKVGLGAKYRLQTLDVVTLGNCSMIYDIPSRWVTNLDPRASVEHELMITSAGVKIKIPSGTDLIIGRSDRYVNFTPDIDLANLDNVANKVSRRHARLSFKPGMNTLFIEDMGSGFGTKINGELIMLGDSRPLFPGDHIWLGGCVLAYDITLR